MIRVGVVLSKMFIYTLKKKKQQNKKRWFVFCNTFLICILVMAGELHSIQFLRQQSSGTWLMKWWLVFTWVNQMYVSTPYLRTFNKHLNLFPWLRNFKSWTQTTGFDLAGLLKQHVYSSLSSWKLQELSNSEDSKITGSENRTNSWI